MTAPASKRLGRGAARRLAAAAAVVGFALAAAAPATAKPHGTEDCFAFWRLLQRLEADGVAEQLKRPPEPEALSKAQLERIKLYLKLEERLLFRCPEFAPPPVRRPSRENEDSG